MIKAIIFDFGNVICSFDNNIFLNKIAKYSNKNIKELKELIYKNNNLALQYEKGEISTSQFINKVVKLGNLNISRGNFISYYTNIFTPIKPTINLIKKLKLNYKLGLISNTNKLHFDFYISKLKIFNLFDVVSLSYKVKALKPEEKIFKDCLKKLNCQPFNCIYIDDIKEYVEKAKLMGMQGIQYTSNLKLRHYLKKLKVCL